MKNNYRVDGEVAYIELNYKGLIMEAIIDACEIEQIDKFSNTTWFAAKNGKTFYSKTKFAVNKKDVTFFLHRLLLGFPEGLEVDHINRNGLDNRKSNLRVVTRRENNLNQRIPFTNSSGYRNVHWNKSANQWEASLKILDKSHYIGCFKDPLKAAQAAIEFKLSHGLYVPPEDIRLIKQAN